MRKVVSICDLHRIKSKVEIEAPEDPFQFSVDGESYEMEACIPCRDEFWQLIADYVDSARRPDGAKGRSGLTGSRPRMKCPYCEKDVSIGSGAKRHIAADHPERLAEYLAEHPNKKYRRSQQEAR